MTTREAKIKALRIASDRCAGFPDAKVSIALKAVSKELTRKADALQRTEDRAKANKGKKFGDPGWIK